MFSQTTSDRRGYYQASGFHPLSHWHTLSSIKWYSCPAAWLPKPWASDSLLCSWSKQNWPVAIVRIQGKAFKFAKPVIWVGLEKLHQFFKRFSPAAEILWQIRLTNTLKQPKYSEKYFKGVYFCKVALFKWSSQQPEILWCFRKPTSVPGSVWSSCG